MDQLLRVEGCFIRFSADGRLMASRQGLNLNLWEVDTPEADRWLHQGTCTRRRRAVSR